MFKAFFMTRTGLAAFLSIPFLFLTSISASNYSVARVDFFDSHDNHLYYLTFDYDGNDNIVSRTFYDKDGYFLRRIQATNDGTGKRTRHVYRDYKEDTVNDITYTYGSGSVGFSITDNYHEPKNVYQGSFKAGTAQGNYEFYDAGSALTHKLDYEYGPMGNITKINVYDKSGSLSHYLNVTYKDSILIERPGLPAVSKQAVIRFASQSRVDLLITVDKREYASAEIFNIQGKKVCTLLDRAFVRGAHFVSFRMGAFGFVKTSGIYVLKVSVKDKIHSKRIAVIN